MFLRATGMRREYSVVLWSDNFKVMEKAFTSSEYPVFRVTIRVQELQLLLSP